MKWMSPLQPFWGCRASLTFTAIIALFIRLELPELVPFFLKIHYIFNNIHYNISLPRFTNNASLQNELYTMQ